MRYGPDIVRIPSRTRPGIVYEVNALQMQCQCEAFQFRRWCWHLSEARGIPHLEDDMTTQLPAPAAPPPAPAQQPIDPDTMAAVLGGGDLAALTNHQRVEYLDALCRATGLNPLTKPFEFIWLQKRLTIYATASAFQQLAGIHKVHLRIDHRERHADGWEVWATAKFPDGREVQDVGWVGLAKGVTGEAAGNALKKAVTQAYRRSIRAAIGLPFNSPEEVDSIPPGDVRHVVVDTDTGEIKPEPRPVHTLNAPPKPAPEPVVVPAAVQEMIGRCETPEDFTDLLATAKAEAWRDQPWARQVNLAMFQAAGTRGIAHSDEAGWYYVSDADPEPALFGAEVA